MQKIDIDNLNPIIEELLKLRGIVSKETHLILGI